MVDKKTKLDSPSRRGVLKAGAAIAMASPMFYLKDSWAAADQVYRNAPKGATVTHGFNVPQSGAYAD
ncbi:MAG: branched-chain amino acid transport system substrate-binding protein [Arenicella sp.]|jgi:branched-chain amino acid transport system substrate-binding protein